MWLTAGRPSRARRIYEQALASATAKGEPYPRATPDLHVGLAELDLERNDLKSAQEHLETAQVLGKRTSITENRYRWFAVSAHLHLAHGNHSVAMNLLNEAQELYLPGAYPEIRPIHAMRARAHIRAGQLDEAQQWAEEQQVSLDDDVTFLREYEQLTLVRLRLALTNDERSLAYGAVTIDAGWNPTLDQVRQTLDRMHTAAENVRAGTALEVGMLRALTLRAAGEEEAALNELTRALVLAPEPDQYVRLFLDEGAPMLALLGDAGSTARGPKPAAAQQARSILGQFSRESVWAIDAAPTKGKARTDVVLADPLSERELEVLRLLNSELSGPEIASHMFVSLNTLRTHTKRIYTKLGVRNRAAAVRRGREYGLL